MSTTVNTHPRSPARNCHLNSYNCDEVLVDQQRHVVVVLWACCNLIGPESQTLTCNTSPRQLWKCTLRQIPGL
jgi:hypothetical protein